MPGCSVPGLARCRPVGCTGGTAVSGFGVVLRAPRGVITGVGRPARDGLSVFLDLAATAPDALGLNAALVTAPPAPFIPPGLHGRPVVVLAGGFVGSLDAGAQLLAPIREFAEPALDTFGPLPYTALQAMVD